MASAATGQPDFVRLRHVPRKPAMAIFLKFGEAICRGCGHRKSRKGGTSKGGRFYCAECK